MLRVPDLLDTNILVHLVRDSATGQLLKRERQLLLTEDVPAFCVVTEGELRSLAYQFGWGHDKAEQMRFLLDYFRRIPIETPEMIEAYTMSFLAVHSSLSSAHHSYLCKVTRRT